MKFSVMSPPGDGVSIPERHCASAATTTCLEHHAIRNGIQNVFTREKLSYFSFSHQFNKSQKTPYDVFYCLLLTDNGVDITN